MNAKSLIILVGWLTVSCLASAQTPSAGADTVPVLVFDSDVHDFGTVSEKDKYAVHSFSFTNTGKSPLVVNNVTSSCGCTATNWTKTPVDPGKTGIVTLTYSTVGRVGAINKVATVFTNEEGGFKRHRLSITGTVVEKPNDPPANFIDTIGGVAIESVYLNFENFNFETNNLKSFYIKNTNKDAGAYFSIESLTTDTMPQYLYLKYPDSLKADWPGQIDFTINGPLTTEKRGRVVETYRLSIKDNAGQLLGTKDIKTAVNHLDDFRKLSTLQSVSAPQVDINNTVLNFGTVKTGFLGLFGGKAKQQFVLTNKGKSDLILHTVSSDDPRVHLPDLKGRTVKAGESLAVTVTVIANELDSDLSTDVYIVCNDPKGPVRRVKIDAQKAK